MGLSLRNGDYVPDGTGGLRRTEGREALLEQVILTESGGGRAQVTVGLTWQGEALSVTVEVS